MGHGAAACTLAAATAAYWLYRKLNRPRVTLEPSAALGSSTTAAASGTIMPSPANPGPDGSQMYVDLGVYGLPTCVKERPTCHGFDMINSMRIYEAAPPPSKVQPSMAASAAASSNSTDGAPFPLGTTAKLTGLMKPRRSSLIKSGDRKVMEFSPALAPGMNPRRSSLIKTGDRKMSQVRAFSPKLALWELARHHPDELVEPGAFDFESALLFIGISGFTALCTKLDIDALQKHINTYIGILIDVVSQHDGDVLRFAGDALYCAWSLPCGAADEGTLALATLAACRCALELHEKCSSYLIDELNQTLSMCVPSPPPPRI